MNRSTDRILTACRIIAVCLVLAAGLSASDAAGQEFTVELNPADTAISFTLHATMHTVHGTFKLKSGSIRFNPSTGAASGLVVVDVTSGDTGNDGRDRKMHRDILESSKYPEAIFSPTKVSGQFSSKGSSTVELSGIFRLHGSDHPVTLSLPVQVEGSVVRTSTHLVIPYVAWGLKNPSTFVLRVGDKLDLEIKTSGRLAGSQQVVTR
jgi:polyisoprenoid-binding protein YceI